MLYAVAITRRSIFALGDALIPSAHGMLTLRDARLLHAVAAGLTLNNEVIRAERIDLHFPEITGTDLVLEEDIHIGVGEAFWLRKAKVGPEETEEIHAAPEESRFAAPVPGGRVHEARLEHAGDHAGNLIDITGQDDGLDSETGRWEFGDKGIADGSDREIVNKSEHKHQSANCPASSGCQLWYSKAT